MKLDENLGQSHVEILQQSGYSADRVSDEGLSGANDDIIWQQVCAEGRFFITLDLDFSDVRRLQDKHSEGDETRSRSVSEGDTRNIPADNRTLWPLSYTPKKWQIYSFRGSEVLPLRAVFVLLHLYYKNITRVSREYYKIFLRSLKTIPLHQVLTPVDL